MRGSIDKGRIGEDIAVNYLKLAGYEILARNKRFGHLEVDVIAGDSRCIAFVEVKTRMGKEFGRAVDAVNTLKMKRLIKAAAVFIKDMEYRRYPDEFRIDLIAIDVDLKGGSLKLKHLRGIS